MGKRIAVSVLVSSGLLLGVVAPSVVFASQPLAGSGASPTTTVIAPVERPEPSVSPRVAEAVRSPADDLERTARSLFGDRFAGLSAVDSELTVHVKGDVSGGTPNTLDGHPVVLERYSWGELDDAKVRLDLDYQKVQDRGFVLASWYVDIAANALRVDVVAEGARVEDAEAAIAEVVPGIALVVVPVEGLAIPTARHNDTAGWGAAKIVSTQTCTSGFGWRNQYGDDYMLTAGHCSLTSPAIWMNGSGSAAYGWQTWNGLDGASPWRNDIAVMTSVNGWGPFFYIAGPTNNGGVRVTTFYSGSQAGLGGIITSGAATGEYQVSPGAVVAQNVTVTNGYGTINGLTIGQCYAAAGDSGAPVYRVGTGGTIELMGILSGSARGLPNAECYYTPTSIILAHHGGWALY